MQGFGAVSQPATGLAGGLDGIHEGHLRYDDALAAAHGAGTFPVEGEVGLFHLVCTREGLSDVSGYVHVGARSGAQAHTDILLTDIDHFAGIGILLTETFHQRTLARSGHAGHYAEDAHREVDRQPAQVVERRIFHAE